MSGRYARWLIAKGNVFSPAAASVVKFAERLRKEQFIGADGEAIATVEKGSSGKCALPATLTKDWLEAPDRDELRLVWRSGGKYPLSITPEGTPSWTLEVHRAEEYIYPLSDTIGRVPSICNCGEDLAFEWDEDELVPAFERSIGIFAECEECSRTFDPSKGVAKIKNAFDGTVAEVRGGSAYRFALKVDCGESFAEDPRLAFSPELVALVESEFGREFYEVGTRY